MNMFLNSLKLPKLNQEEINNVNRPPKMRRLGQQKKSLPVKKVQDQKGSQQNFIIISKRSTTNTS